MLADLAEYRAAYLQLREFAVANHVPPAIQFHPIPVGMTFETERRPLEVSRASNRGVPEDPQDLAFYSVRDLAALLRKRKVTSTELTRLYLDRLKRYGPELECVVKSRPPARTGRSLVAVIEATCTVFHTERRTCSRWQGTGRHGARRRTGIR